MKAQVNDRIKAGIATAKATESGAEPVTGTDGRCGSLTCVGTGMTLGAHICPLSKSYITQADVVFCGVSNGIVELWIKEMHPDVRSLQGFYRTGKDRRQSYREMVDAMLTEVRAGKRVVGAFYGHPGVFSYAPHKAIEVARAEGYVANMLPGISAQDCLYADLGIDPGQFGCQHFEASQFMFYRRRFDPSAYLVLWQIGLAGDKSSSRFGTGAAHRAPLLQLLATDYPNEHEVILYEAAVLPIEVPRMERLPLAKLLEAKISQHTTLVIPPSRRMQPNHELLAQLAAIDREFDAFQA